MRLNAAAATPEATASGQNCVDVLTIAYAASSACACACPGDFVRLGQETVEADDELVLAAEELGNELDHHWLVDALGLVLGHDVDERFVGSRPGRTCLLQLNTRTKSGDRITCSKFENFGRRVMSS